MQQPTVAHRQTTARHLLVNKHTSAAAAGIVVTERHHIEGAGGHRAATVGHIVPRPAISCHDLVENLAATSIENLSAGGMVNLGARHGGWHEAIAAATVVCGTRSKHTIRCQDQ